MRPEIQSLCDHFIANRDVIKKNFFWENANLYPVCANLFTARGKTTDANALMRCKEIVKRETSVFSSFRGNIKLPVICTLALSDDPQDKMNRALQSYDLLRQHFWPSEYLALGALLLADAVEAPTAENAARARALYNRMKKEHPFLTSSEDSVFAVLLALSGRDDDTLIEDMEACYQALKTRFHASNDVQAMTHVLALAEGESQEKTSRTIDLYDAIVMGGDKYSRSYALSTLAALAAQKGDVNQMAADISDAGDFLSHQKGYGFFGFGKRTRMMHAAMIVSNAYAPAGNAGTAALTGALALIAAEHAAMCAAMASSAAASSASH